MANLYEAVFKDARGKSFPARLRAASDADAKAVANAMAGQSDAEWLDLLKIIPIAISAADPTPNALGVADVTSDIQRKGHLNYTSTVGGAYITIEIPAVKPSYLSKTSPSNTTDPLTSDQRATLMKLGGSTAVQLHHTKYGTRSHKK